MGYEAIDAVVIEYALPEASEVKMVLYDVLGREVLRLVEGSQAAGRYVVRFEASGLSSGMYFYRMEAGSFSRVHKMVLLR